MAYQIQTRRDTAANWTSTNPVLAEGEWGWEKDTDKFKIGDGVTAWTALPYEEASVSKNGFLSSGDWATFSTKLSDAPSDGSEYVRKDGAWTVASGGGGTQQDLFLGGYRPPGTKNSYKLEYYSLANATTVDLLPTITGAGYVDWMFLGVPYGQTLTITIDGVVTYLGEVQRFFAAEYADTQAPYAGKWFQFNGNASGLGLCSRIPIPFGSSIRIQLTNSSGSAKTLFTQITYQLGVPASTWSYSRKLWAVSGLNSSVTPNQTLTLVDATGTSPGVLAGVYWHYDGYPGSVSPKTGPLEGNFQVFVDGSATPSFESPGTEDYFGMSNYFMNFLPVQVESSPLTGFCNNTSDDIGLTIRTNQNPPNTVAAFRMHPKDPVAFTNELKVVWNCGNTSQAAFTGNSRIAWCVWYYTQ